MAAFLRSTGGHGLRIEEKHQRTGIDQALQCDGLVVLITELEVVDDVALVHLGTLALPVGARYRQPR